ncbi:protein phosphatase inhibitor 2 [Lycodopsis pacificus]
MAALRPIKGILKNKNSGTNVQSLPEELPEDSPEQEPVLSEDDPQKKSQKWDEMNILATYHPADKDYGMMKIDEPSTPYNRMVGDEDDEGALSDSDGHGGLAADDLASKLVAAESSEPRFMKEEVEEEEGEETSEEEEDELSPEEQAKKTHFQMMRKMHYNEGMNIKLARQLIASELEEDADEEMRDDTEEVKEDTEEAKEDTEETEEISVDPPQEADSLDS